jgi:hypothetical protein
MRKKLVTLAAFMMAISSIPANAGFGSVQLVENVRVTRIFSGISNTYVEFTSLPGCINGGGYLTVTWPAANGGSVNEDRTKQLIATLLFAKATETTMQVRYRLPNSPTGWDSCAVDAVLLN